MPKKRIELGWLNQNADEPPKPTLTLSKQRKKEMRTWQKNPKTTLPKVMPLENPLLVNSEKIEDVTEEQVKRLIGQTLTQTSYMLSYAQWLEQVAQSNLATPVMVEAWSFALWVMVNHLTSMCDQLKTLICTFSPSKPITVSEHRLWDAIDEIQHIVDEVAISTFGS